MPLGSYQRLFGSGPTGALMSLLLLVLAWQLEPRLALPVLLASESAARLLSIVPLMVGIWLLVWSLKSLPVAERGRGLVTTGAFRYFRHPFYAAWLSGFNFVLVLWLNNWIYLFWALLLHPLWHWHIRYEESLMSREFGDAYRGYAQHTGRFVPRWRKSP